MKRVFNFAMPFLQASLVKQILVGLVLGIALAYAAPAAAVKCGFLGTVFVTALKAVAPILVFVLVMSSIANQNLSGENFHIKSILVLYLIGTFSAAIVAVVASFMFPTKLILTATDAAANTPGGIGEVLGNVILNVVDQSRSRHLLGQLHRHSRLGCRHGRGVASWYRRHARSAQ